MALKILSESYGPRKPLIRCEADSLDELSELECAEGSIAEVGGEEYVLDRVNGWVVPGSGGGGGGGVLVVGFTVDDGTVTLDKTWQEIHDAMLAGVAVLNVDNSVFFASNCSDSDYYVVEFVGFAPQDGELIIQGFEASSADDYPTSLIL